MKDRGRLIGEAGAHRLLRQLQDARADARFHLMGHSFGCIVVSAAAAGPAGGGLARPVDSLVLVQGALSLWSYCSRIDGAGGRPGYFRRAGNAVKGPLVTTQSVFDTAVGRLYPLAAGVARQVVFAPEEFPRYGGVGTFGLQGPGLDIVGGPMLAADADYNFQPGKIYNLNGDAYIRNGGGLAGAHSDITGPQVAHAVWEAARG
jgi:pimeloyl-ACP methyl ester carboxylesterase